jgi:translation initiation factor SUI1
MNEIHVRSMHEIHVRLFQRTAHKTLTTIKGFDYNLDLKKILRYLKKTFNCNENIIKNNVTGKEIIKLTGDQRDNVS